MTKERKGSSRKAKSQPLCRSSQSRATAVKTPLMAKPAITIEMIPNRLWTEKSSAAGKDFTRLACSFFPKTVAYVKSLPFESIGRCNIMGLEAHDHGTVHRDGEPDAADAEVTDQFITLCPAGDKRLFVWDEEG